MYVQCADLVVLIQMSYNILNKFVASSKTTMMSLAIYQPRPLHMLVYKYINKSMIDALEVENPCQNIGSRKQPPLASPLIVQDHKHSHTHYLHVRLTLQLSAWLHVVISIYLGLSWRHLVDWPGPPEAVEISSWHLPYNQYRLYSPNTFSTTLQKYTLPPRYPHMDGFLLCWQLAQWKVVAFRKVCMVTIMWMPINAKPYSSYNIITLNFMISVI